MPVATGVKLADPGLTVIVVTGDGDATAIGGNHLIHAARRNIDMTVVLYNNSIYGMTGGQYSPLTPTGSKATTAPYATIEQDFNVAELVKAAGATFVARGASFPCPDPGRPDRQGYRTQRLQPDRSCYCLPHLLRTPE